MTRTIFVLAMLYAVCVSSGPAAGQTPVTLGGNAATESSNVEMKAIFDADQADRTASKIDWTAVAAADMARQVRTKDLLAQGALHSADDYWEAAFVFQHGDTARSFLLAHVLAMVAVNKGNKDAIWIAAATLDRYLQKIGQKQILGTQYVKPQFFDPKADGPWTQEPYDRDLVSDTLRKELHVESQAQQGEQLKALQTGK